MAEFLVQSGYFIAPADSSLFIKQSGGNSSVVLIYVDDLIITGDHDKEISEIRANLLVRFQKNELGELKHFLGLEIQRTKEEIFFCQQKYAKDILENSGMIYCKPISTPMEPNMNLGAFEGRELKMLGPINSLYKIVIKQLQSLKDLC